MTKDRILYFFRKGNCDIGSGETLYMCCLVIFTLLMCGRYCVLKDRKHPTLRLILIINRLKSLV